MKGGLESGVVVAKCVHCNPADEVEISLSLGIEQANAAAAHELHWSALVRAKDRALEGLCNAGIRRRRRLGGCGCGCRIHGGCGHAHMLPALVNVVPRSSCSIAAMSEIRTRSTPPS